MPPEGPRTAVTEPGRPIPDNGKQTHIATKRAPFFKCQAFVIWGHRTPSRALATMSEKLKRDPYGGPFRILTELAGKGSGLPA